ncbi:MAG: MOSC N-terminal beta barrel domain-containing protein [Jatrophihabitans sp.]
MRLSEINRFPVKSCRGQSLRDALVEPWGLAGDRRWMIVDEDGVLITAREHPRLLLVMPTLRPDGGLSFVSPDANALEVDVPGSSAGLVPVSVWKTTLDATPAADAAHDFFSTVLGLPARLVYLDDPTRRRPSQDFAGPDDRVSFADGYPLHLIPTASLDALNDFIAAGPRADEGPLPIIRFRPSVVVSGSAAWEEDGWRQIRIGEAQFRVVKGCPRCVMTMVDPVSAETSKEPIASLAKHRRWDGATWFGMDLIPDNPGATIRVGDEVEVLHAVPATNGPPR